MKKLFPLRLSFLYIAVFVLALGIFVLLPLSDALAQGTRSDATNIITQITHCENIFGICVGSWLAWLVYFVLQAVSQLFILAGNLIDTVIAFTLNPDMYQVPAIYAGWVVARDTVNLFFIFVLLVIAIATILQFEAYGAKRLLARLIIVALFINFSFALTQYIIISSNLFARLFVPGIGTGATTPSFSAKFVTGVNPNILFASFENNNADSLAAVNASLKAVQEEIGKTTGTHAFGGDLTPEQQGYLETLKGVENQLLAQQQGLEKGAEGLFTQVIVSMIGVIIFLAVATFVLFTVAIMLLVRIVMLWFLMIASPIAFFFWTLPALQSYAREWLSKLVSNALWPVGFFFFFSITVNMIANPFVRLTMGADPSVNKSFISNFQLVMYYILLVMMLLFALGFAKKMGGVSASIADKAIGRLRGYTRAAPGVAWRHGLRRVTLAGSSLLAEKAVGKEKMFGGQKIEAPWLARQLRKPAAKWLGGGLVQRGANVVLNEHKKAVLDREEKLNKRSTDELKDMLRSSFDPATKAAIMDILAKRRDLKLDESIGFTRSAIEQNKRYMRDYGISTKDADALEFQYATAEDLKNKAYAQEVFRGVTSPKLLVDIINEGGDAAKALAAGLRSMGTTMDDVANGLEEVGNTTLAGWFRSNAGRPILEAAGISIEKQTVFSSATVADMKNPARAEEVVKQLSRKTVKGVFEEGGDAAEKMIEAFKTLGKTTDELADSIARAGNPALAASVRGGAYRDELKEAGISTESQQPLEKPTIEIAGPYTRIPPRGPAI
ncbi:MAG: type IV secretion system protein [Candidatus Niyogibacteria bacterium]|nr:type IV secretion system protein [Candidatus Niyogibacteria bacterium]